MIRTCLCMAWYDTSPTRSAPLTIQIIPIMPTAIVTRAGIPIEDRKYHDQNILMQLTLNRSLLDKHPPHLRIRHRIYHQPSLRLLCRCLANTPITLPSRSLPPHPIHGIPYRCTIHDRLRHRATTPRKCGRNGQRGRTGARGGRG